MAKKKLLLIAGHGEGDPGACSIWGHEADYTRELATLIQQAIGNKMAVTMYDQSKNCYAQSKQGNVPDYDAYDFTLEVHFNAKAKKDPYGDGTFTGVGGYKHPQNAGVAVAQSILKAVIALGFKEWLLDDSISLLNLNNAQRQGAKYFLLETAFIDDGDDMQFYTENKARFAQAVAQGLMDGLGMRSEAACPQKEGYYRVRKSWEDAKSQIFAGTKENALKLCGTMPGYSVYDPEGGCIYTKETMGLQAASLKGCSEAEYIEKVGALYTEDEKKNGILACVPLAQSILESGYGQTDLAQICNNMHGMKCILSGNTWDGTTWDGDSFYEKVSPEVISGQSVMKTSQFRLYACIEDSIADHAAYLLNAANGSKQRYAGLQGEQDYKKAIQIIKDGSYATDPEYVSKICNIIERWDLTRFNAGKVNNDTTLDSHPNVQGDTGAGKTEDVFIPYMIRTTCDYLYIRRGPGKNYRAVGHIGEIDGFKKDYTIVEEVDGWGRLKSGAGWICLKYTRKV